MLCESARASLCAAALLELSPAALAPLAQDGDSALMYTALKDQPGAAAALLARGVPLETQNGVSPAARPAADPRGCTVEASPRPLRRTRCRRSAEPLKPAGFLSQTSQKGLSALNLAAMVGATEVARLVLDHGADMESRSRVRPRNLCPSAGDATGPGLACSEGGCRTGLGIATGSLPALRLRRCFRFRRAS